LNREVKKKGGRGVLRGRKGKGRWERKRNPYIILSPFLALTFRVIYCLLQRRGRGGERKKKNAEGGKEEGRGREGESSPAILFFYSQRCLYSSYGSGAGEEARKKRVGEKKRRLEKKREERRRRDESR